MNCAELIKALLGPDINEIMNAENDINKYEIYSFFKSLSSFCTKMQNEHQGLLTVNITGLDKASKALDEINKCSTINTDNLQKPIHQLDALANELNRLIQVITQIPKV